MNEIDEAKLEKMWCQILKYERSDGMVDTDPRAVSEIISIIEEVYKECL